MKKGELIDFVKELYNKIIVKKPPIEKMKEEVKLMGLKVRPLTEKFLDALNSKNERFVEMVWLIGKLDEFLHSSGKKFTREEIDEILTIFSNIYAQELSKELSTKEDFPNLEFEISRQIFLKEKLN